MTFKLIFSGLCAFVLFPCMKDTQTVSVVFPGGPFAYPFEEPYPEHQPTLMVDTLNIDPGSTHAEHDSMQAPDSIIEVPGGKQYAIYDLSGRVTLSIDGITPKVSKDDEFDKKVTKLSDLVDLKPEERNVRSDLRSKRGNPYGRAHLTLPYDENAPRLVPSPIGEYEFSPGAEPKWASDRVSINWPANEVVEFKLHNGKTIRLKDFPKTGEMTVVISGFAPHMGAASTSLEHFPSYFFLLDKFGDLHRADIHVPKLIKPVGNIDPSGVKPVACAVCQDCG